MESLPLAIGVLGAGLGYLLGNKAERVDPSAPLAGAITGAVMFYIAAYMLIVVAGCLSIAIGLVYFFWKVWPTLKQSMVEFSREAGVRVREQRLGPGLNTSLQQLIHRMDEIDREISQVEQSTRTSSQHKIAIIEERTRERQILADILDSLT